MSSSGISPACRSGGITASTPWPRLERTPLACLPDQSTLLPLESITWFDRPGSWFEESVTSIAKPIARKPDRDVVFVHAVILRAKRRDERDHRITGFERSTPPHDGRRSLRPVTRSGTS